jgi:SAM-dependent methyltransferase
MSHTRVLQSTEEMNSAVSLARDAGLPPATDDRKYWDNLLGYEFLKERNVERVADIGCRSGIMLTWLYAGGVRNLSGCDLKRPYPPIKSALTQGKLATAAMGARMYAANRRNMKVASAESTGFPSGAFDAVTSMSVIEHSVNTKDFFAEAYRLLKPQGALFISTDYWPDGGRSGRDIVFSDVDIARLLEEAEQMGLQLLERPSLAVQEAPIHESGLSYTFLTLAFERA